MAISSSLPIIALILVSLTLISAQAPGAAPMASPPKSAPKSAPVPAPVSAPMASPPAPPAETPAGTPATTPSPTTAPTPDSTISTPPAAHGPSASAGVRSVAGFGLAGALLIVAAAF